MPWCTFIFELMDLIKTWPNSVRYIGVFHFYLIHKYVHKGYMQYVMKGLQKKYICTAAPERTERRRGLEGSPKDAPISFWTYCNPSNISSHKPGGSFFPFCWYSLHASVEIVSPGGTDRPMLAISARFAPFPPNCNQSKCLINEITPIFGMFL